MDTKIAQILAALEPMVKAALETAVQTAAPATAPIVDSLIEAGDAAVKRNNPTLFPGQAATSASVEDRVAALEIAVAKLFDLTGHASSAAGNS